MMIFKEIDSSEIKKSYASYFHEKARYFMINKNTDVLCYYGIIDITDEIGETFFICNSFNGKILSKGFILSLFDHACNLGYKELYTWSKWDRLINFCSYLKKYGIEKTSIPEWDKDASKSWFVKRI